MPGTADQSRPVTGGFHAALVSRQLAKEEVLKRDARKFVTAGIWNEVYEDGYLQPDVKYGYEYGKRIKAAFSE